MSPRGDVWRRARGATKRLEALTNTIIGFLDRHEMLIGSRRDGRIKP